MTVHPSPAADSRTTSDRSGAVRIVAVLAAAMVALQCLAIRFASFRVDDWTNLEHGRWAVSGAGRWQVWTEVNPFSLYRPLVDYWHGAMLAVFGLEPRPMVAALIVLMALSSLLLARIVRERGGDRFTALACAAAVWVQPNTYMWTTQWVSNVTASLVGVAALAVLLLHHRAVRLAANGRSTLPTRMAMVLIFFAGALCKEEIVLIPGAIFVLEMARWDRLDVKARPAAWHGFLLMAATAAVFAVARTQLLPRPPSGGRYHLALGLHSLVEMRFLTMHLAALPIVAAIVALALIPVARSARTWREPSLRPIVRDALAGLAWTAISTAIFLLIQGRPAYGYLYVPAFAMAFTVGQLLGALHRATAGSARVALPLLVHALVASALTAWGLLDVRWPSYGPLTRAAYAELDRAVPQPTSGEVFAFVDPGTPETRAGRTLWSMVVDYFVGPFVRLHYGRNDIDAVLVTRTEDIPARATVAFIARGGQLSRIPPGPRTDP